MPMTAGTQDKPGMVDSEDLEQEEEVECNGEEYTLDWQIFDTDAA